MGREEWERAFHYLHVGPIAGAIGSGAGQGKDPGVCGMTELTHHCGVLHSSPGSP